MEETTETIIVTVTVMNETRMTQFFLTCLLNYVMCMINETAALEYKGLSLKIKKAYAALDPEKSRPFIFIC